MIRFQSRPARTRAGRSPRASLVALAGACVALLQPALALSITPPPVPMKIEVPGAYRLFRLDHAIGTQNYYCRANATPPGFMWVQYGPQATLFSAPP